MNRTITALALAAAAVFGLSACSGSAAPAEKEPVAEAPAPEPAEESTGIDASLQACLDLQAPMAEALEGMLEAQAGDGSAYEEWNASWNELTDALGRIAQTAADPDMKSTAAEAHTHAAKVGELMPKIQAGDVSAASELVTAQGDFQSAYSKLITFCMP
ncbi:MAG: hypothetical protein AB7V10_08960 [Leucobacter sp.]|jgi:hypothetical protein